MKALAALILFTVTACPPPSRVGPPSQPHGKGERTWWYLCWQDGIVETPIYPLDRPPYTPGCQHPEVVSWPGRVVFLTVDTTAAYYRADILSAAEKWNAWAGRTVFVEMPNAPVVMKVDAEVAKYAAALASHYRHRGVLFADVTFAPLLSRPYMVSLHEMGHLLGFGHDSDVPGSLMHPTGAAVEITAADLAALRERYGGSR